MPHESVAKGFSGIWLGQSTNFATVGWSKGSDRQIAVWDSRKATKPCTVQTIDVSSSALSPFYDADLSVLYLVERGTKTFMYEVVKSDPWVTAVGKFEAKSTQSGAAMLPKRNCNVMNCEVSRWLYATSTDGVDVVSFFLPRKDKTVFQEDLFPPAECGEPAYVGRPDELHICVSDGFPCFFTVFLLLNTYLEKLSLPLPNPCAQLASNRSTNFPRKTEVVLARVTRCGNLETPQMHHRMALALAESHRSSPPET
jgi:hypothetical protein